MNVAYITAQVPWGRGESFVIDEMRAVKEAGADLMIIPRNPTREVFHQEARPLLENAVWLPLIDLRMFASFALSLLIKPRIWKVVGMILWNSRNLHILVKNLAVVPKGIYIASLLKNVDHIHVHWGSTTATMAWIASELTSIPWSVTLHRWDIAENNMLKLKVERAVFSRCISEDGRREVLSIVGEADQDKVKVLHMGVRIPEISPPRSLASQSDFVIVCPANHVPKKAINIL